MEEEIVKEQEEVIETPETEEVTEVQPGEKTDPTLLLKSLHEEREAKRTERERRIAAEQELARLKETPENGEVVSEEGRALQAEIRRLQTVVATTEHESKMTKLRSTYPALAEKEEDFKDFLLNPENSGMKLETAAKAFIAENNLFEKPAIRKGLEKETGGTRTPVKNGITPDEIEEMRVNNYAEYSKRIRSGTLFT